MDDDDWDLSAEQLDSLERDACQKLAQQRSASASAPAPPPPPPVIPDSRSNKVK